MPIEQFFSGFGGKGKDGKDGIFDGKAFVNRTGPDYYPETWTVSQAKAKRRGNGADLCDDRETVTELEEWIRQHPKWVAEIEAKLGLEK